MRIEEMPVKKVPPPKIDFEFDALLPPLADEEYAELKRKIEYEGFKGAITVWEETGTLVDGKHRLRICDELGINCPVQVMSFDSRDEAICWIINNQRGRRNLTDEWKSYLRGKDYRSSKQAEPFKNADISPVGKSCPPIERSSEAIAEKHGVSERTIRSDAKFSEAVDVAPDKQQILDGTSGKTKAEVIAGAPLFCNKCTRLSPVPKCKFCIEVRKEAGVNLKTGIPAKPKKEKKPKSGAVLFDWIDFERAFGVVARAPNAIGSAYPGEKDSHEYQRIMDHLDPIAELFKKWKKRVTKSQGI